MSWIETVAFDRATGRLRTLFERIAGPDGGIDNILRVHALRPHTLEGHMALYKAVLHHNGNRLPRWVLETLGVHVSRLNACDYCVEHHAAGLRRLLGQRADALLGAIAVRFGPGRAAVQPGPSAGSGTGSDLDDLLDARLDAMIRYATRLTQRPHAMAATDVEALRAAGLDDGEVLELNQVVSYFAYANRTVLGLGVTTDGDVLGRSPGNQDDEDDWTHR